MGQVKRKRKRTRRTNVREAEKIFSWLIGQQELAEDLIRRSAKRVKSANEAADVRLDLHLIVTILAAAQAHEKEHPVWEVYQQHFVGDANRQSFFLKLRQITWRLASSCLASVGDSAVDLANELDSTWDASLLPTRTAPHVLRLAILHPGILEFFLPRYFVLSSDLLAQRSPFRRKMRILQNVKHFGWSAKKHTAELLKSRDVQFGSAGSDEETIKKLIRDLRSRYRKHISRVKRLKRQRLTRRG